jgi:Fungal ubiquitin-associated domain
MLSNSVTWVSHKPKWHVPRSSVFVEIDGLLTSSLFFLQIDVLRRLNYRGANVANIGDDRIVEELLK